MPLTPAPRLDAVVAHVLAWHNRHPLARRIKVTQVGSIGLVSLPFSAPAAGAALPVAAFSEDFLQPIKPAVVGRWAARHAHADVTVPHGVALRQVAAERDGPGITLVVATAAIEVGSQQRRLLVGRGDPAAVLGRRIWSKPRVGVAGALLLALTTLPLWPSPWLQPAETLASAQLHAETALAPPHSVGSASAPGHLPADAGAPGHDSTKAKADANAIAPASAPTRSSLHAGASAPAAESVTLHAAATQANAAPGGGAAADAQAVLAPAPASHSGTDGAADAAPAAPSQAESGHPPAPELHAAPQVRSPGPPARASAERPAARLGAGAARPAIRPQLDEETKAEAREAVAEARRALGLPAAPAVAATAGAVHLPPNTALPLTATATATATPAATAAFPAPASMHSAATEGRPVQGTAPHAASLRSTQPAPQRVTVPADLSSGPAFALSTRLLRTRAEAEQVMAAVQALLMTVRGKDNPPLQVEIVAVGEDWRVAAFPFRRQPEADQARALLASRGMRVSVVDF